MLRTYRAKIVGFLISLVAGHQLLFLAFLEWKAELKVFKKHRRASIVQQKRRCNPLVYNVNIGLNESESPKLYLCGWIKPPAVHSWLHLFPNHIFVPLHPNDCAPTHSSRNDIFLTSESPLPSCDGIWETRLDFHGWVDSFPGKVLVRNAESYDLWSGPEKSNIFHVGYYPDSRTNRTMRLTALQTTLLEYGESWWPKLIDHSQKPKNSQERFMVYASTNCVILRDLAADRLSDIDIIDKAGLCSGRRANRTRFREPPVALVNEDWQDNKERFSIYRFCLVMENTYQDGYITEKILNAFLAGCVPIWYGTSEVFDMFNPKAFIYYNISNPRSAVERVRYLEANRTAYNDVLNQPILAHGEETIRKYFSFTESIGDGHLLKKLSRFLNNGLDNSKHQPTSAYDV